MNEERTDFMNCFSRCAQISLVPDFKCTTPDAVPNMIRTTGDSLFNVTTTKAIYNRTMATGLFFKHKVLRWETIRKRITQDCISLMKPMLRIISPKLNTC